jgi:formylglycine-generating enzyme required for sulfatase activity
MLSEHPRQQLIKMLQQFGQSVCADSKRCEAILRDLCPEHKRETNLLIAALKERVASELLKNETAVSMPLQINQLAQRLHDNLGIAEHFAVWAVESWALALGLIEQANPVKAISTASPFSANLPRSNNTLSFKTNPLKPLGDLLTKLLTSAPVKKVVETPRKIYPAIFFHDAFKDGKPAIKMVRIQGGHFLMGSPAEEAGRYSIERLHEVTVKDFIIGQYAVTFAEYDLYVKAAGARKPSDNGWGRGLRPVINVSWKDALSYADWLSTQTGFTYRLPTEAEWEYACRAGTDTPFSTGEFISTEQANFNGSIDYGLASLGKYRQKTVEVGSFAANPFGLYDMHGNVWEWTASIYSENYNGEELRCFNPYMDAYRILRGGSWINTKRSLRSASRIRRDANDSADFIGFRLARDI